MNQIYSISQRSQLFFTRSQQKNNYYYNQNHNTPLNANYLSLVNKIPNILKIIPKQFTISTKNSSGKFNTDFLIETCSTISSFIKEIPHDFEYHLEIDDPRNVLSKFEQLFQGQKVIFEEEDLPTCVEITDKLFLVCCPNYMKPEHLKCSERGYSYNYVNADANIASGVEMAGITQFLKKADFECFTIKTNKKKYKCNKFGILLSDLIREKLSKEPLLKQFDYDFDDENNEFQGICDLFNFYPVEITRDNMDSLKELAEDFQVNGVIDEIVKYINDSEKVAQTIDDQQTIIDSINELFDWLYNIKSITVDSVRNYIVDSFWVETEENVQELVAFILEAVRTDILLHPYLVDLLIQLNEQANETNALDVLIPFIVSKLLNFLSSNHPQSTNLNLMNSKSSYICSFIYRLYKKGIIQKDQLIDKLKKYNFSDKIINAWFLPILVEMDKRNIDCILQTGKNKTGNSSSSNSNGGSISSDPYYPFIKSYLPDKVDLYELMLDNGEPDDAITKSLRNDDVDTFQLITSQNPRDFKTQFVPYNIYDDFMQVNPAIGNSKIRYLNYAAAFGSIKCFKYLILNHDTIDEKTFEFAVYGGNNEIIKIVDQNSSSTTNSKFNGINGQKMFSYDGFGMSKPLSFNALSNAIVKHKNDIFDWIFEKDNDSFKNLFYQLATVSSIGGNAHALIEIIDRGFDLKNNQDIIQNISRNGFYRLALLLSIIIENQKNKPIKKRMFMRSTDGYNYIYKSTNKNNNQTQNLYAVYFGNLSIFKLFMKEFNQLNIEELICFSVENNYMSIINFFFDCLLSGEIKFQENYLYGILRSSLKRKSNKLFNYLLEKFKAINTNFIISVKFYLKLLRNACKYSNFEGVKTITEIILNEDESKTENFSSAFNSAASVGAIDLCQYFIDKKVNIVYDNILPQSKLNVELFSFILSKINPSLKQFFFSCIDQAIKDENKELVEYLFKQNASSEKALINAVLTHNVDIVDIVLKYNKKPFFINQIFATGTALQVAVEQNDLDIVKHLLSVPGINPALYNEPLKYPLITSIEKYSIEVIDAILDFYGDDIKFQREQLDDALKIVFNLYSSDSYKQNPLCLDAINRVLDIKYIDVNKIYENQLYNQQMHEYEMNPLENYSDDDMNNDIDNNDNNNDEDDEVEHLRRRRHRRRSHRKMLKKNSNKCSFLLCACINNDIEMVERLLKIETIDTNKFSYKTGDSPLIIAVRENFLEIAKLLIDFPLTNVNHRNYKIQTALTIAAKNNSFEIISLLIKNEKFDPEESQFNLAFYMANNKISKKLISLDFLDINYQYNDAWTHNLSTQIQFFTFRNNRFTKLTKAAKNNDIELVEMIINHPMFDKNKSQIDMAIKYSIEYRNFDIFKRLLKLVDDDINLCDCSGNSLLIHAIHSSNTEVIDFILSNDNFDSNKSDILKAFVDVYSYLDGKQNIFDLIDISDTNFDEKDGDNNDDDDDGIGEMNEFELDEEEEEEDDHEVLNFSDPVEIVSKLYEYDKQHDNLIDLKKLLPNGKSFYTIILFPIQKFIKIIDFLLENGCDPNQPDSMKVYPLEKAITLNSYEFVAALINSNKIDFSIKIPIKESSNNSRRNLNGLNGFGSIKLKDIKSSDGECYTTYLHIAAQCYCQQILEEFLERDLIDVNEVDDLGNTALINLCIYGNSNTFQCFNNFFRKENLDYLHKNNEGLDALSVLKLRHHQIDFNEEITEKGDYLNKLIEISEMIFNRVD